MATLNVNSVENDSSPLLSSFTPSESISREPSPRPYSSRRQSESLLRQPVSYQSISSSYNGTSHHDSHTTAVISRYKYYNRLAPHSESNFTMPDHVVPNYFLISNVTTRLPGSQPSWVTIFSLWNTMMGTSLLSMPWAINQAGFVCGISFLLFMAALMLYTSYRILYTLKGFKSDSEVVEFSDVCRHYLGRWAEWIAFGSSILTLLGGMIVYWILISNFLYNIVTFIYHHVRGDFDNEGDSTGPICPSNMTRHHTNYTNSTDSGEKMFFRIWDQQKTVPLLLIVIIMPLLNFKSPTFFTKFNALGTISVTYLVCFAMKNAISWGIHLDFHDVSSPVYVYEFKTTFPALTGVAALAYFVQNCVISITRTAKHPEHIVRDLVIAYCLVAVTYVYMGVLVYVSFNLNKNCLEDNFLNNLSDSNIMAFIARVGLFFQMLCVFPLLVFICRVQFMNSLFGSVWPGLRHIISLNTVLVAVCVVFAMFLPHIGKIIGFVGAFCGFTYAIALPCCVFMVIRHRDGTLTLPIIVIHSVLIVIGLANFIGQFLLL